MIIKKETTRFSDENNHVFFGYYDVSPIDYENKYMLAMHLPLARDDQMMSVGYYDLNDSSKIFNSIGQTETWCWQQGCRLRWLPSEENCVIFNTIVDSRYGAIIYDLKSNKVLRKINSPIYDIDPKGEIGASLNFSRLQRLRPGYGYKSIPDHSISEMKPKYDGLFLVDIKNNGLKMVVSLDEISNYKNEKIIPNSEHYINHIFFSPDSRYIFFFHLWADKKSRDSRLFRYDIEKDKLKLIIDNTVSHYTWKDDKSFIITEFHNEKLSYNIYDLDGSLQSVIGNDLLIKDGHPSFCSKNDFLISDTYPNYFGFQQLFKYDLKLNSYTPLCNFYTKSKFQGEQKCDLHPRLSHDGKTVCVDVVDNGKREMAIISL